MYWRRFTSGPKTKGETKYSPGLSRYFPRRVVIRSAFGLGLPRLPLGFRLGLRAHEYAHHDQMVAGISLVTGQRPCSGCGPERARHPDAQPRRTATSAPSANAREYGHSRLAWSASLRAVSGSIPGSRTVTSALIV